MPKVSRLPIGVLLVLGYREKLAVSKEECVSHLASVAYIDEILENLSIGFDRPDLKPLACPNLWQGGTRLGLTGTLAWEDLSKGYVL